MIPQGWPTPVIGGNIVVSGDPSGVPAVGATVYGAGDGSGSGDAWDS